MAAAVLVVEDEPKLCDLVRAYLERDGLGVLSTGSGAGAIALAAEARPDLIVLDLRLPDVSGESVAKEVRLASDVPILMLTAETSEEDASLVTAGGRIVGSITLRFPRVESAAFGALRSHLVRTVAIGAALAALLAVAMAILVARRITRPVARLTRVARARESGDRGARVGQLRAATELKELGAAFDRMADASGREDELRRTLVADVAHELWIPISVLLASCEAILDGVVEFTPEVVSSMHEEVVRLATRVEDVVLASAEAAGLRLAAEPVDLAQVARRCHRLVFRIRCRGRRTGHGPRVGDGGGRPNAAASDHHQPADQRSQVHSADVRVGGPRPAAQLCRRRNQTPR